MTENINTNNTPVNNNRYAESKGTGVLSTLIFAVVVTIIMIVVAYFKGSVKTMKFWGKPSNFKETRTNIYP